MERWPCMGDTELVIGYSSSDTWAAIRSSARCECCTGKHSSFHSTTSGTVVYSTAWPVLGPEVQLSKSSPLSESHNNLSIYSKEKCWIGGYLST